MRKLFLVTSSFPYYPGEEFLDTEVSYWEKCHTVSVTILPRTVEEKKVRELPAGVVCDLFLVTGRVNQVYKKLHLLFKALFTHTFYKGLYKEVIPDVRRIKPFLSAMTGYQQYYELFDTYLMAQNDDVRTYIFYTYWHNNATYALQSLKQRYGFTIISRTHGGDLYCERKSLSYQPLKSLFTQNIDHIFTITPSAIDYLQTTYGFSKNTLSTARLGVDDHDIKTKATETGRLHLVSCSSLVLIKRIDKLINALAETPQNSIQIKWTHIGSGPLENKLKDLAEKKLGKIAHINYDFIGHIEHKKIFDFYKKNEIDFFVNVSDFEGVPVSIMEAMSCYIPIIAPNIGGVSDMIEHKKNGLLLPKSFSTIMLSNALQKSFFFKDNLVRENAYKMFLEKYDANKNYPEFINKIELLGTKHSIIGDKVEEH
jgi:glycosyltransferase involved in cell wall biosynthesis